MTHVACVLSLQRALEDNMNSTTQISAQLSGAQEAFPPLCWEWGMGGGRTTHVVLPMQCPLTLSWPRSPWSVA